MHDWLMPLALINPISFVKRPISAIKEHNRARRSIPATHDVCNNRKMELPVTQTNQWITAESIMSFLRLDAFKTTE